jgi:hypothetical protein
MTTICDGFVGWMFEKLNSIWTLFVSTELWAIAQLGFRFFAWILVCVFLTGIGAAYMMDSKVELPTETWIRIDIWSFCVWPILTMKILMDYPQIPYNSTKDKMRQCLIQVGWCSLHNFTTGYALAWLVLGFSSSWSHYFYLAFASTFNTFLMVWVIPISPIYDRFTDEGKETENAKVTGSAPVPITTPPTTTLHAIYSIEEGREEELDDKEMRAKEENSALIVL